ncbi:cytochrome P450 [Deinococcus maricopensis]|uniref:Cytochrome P450 n=1 Tax=Deinococcus maricopensis (strain DSM 21211 / LMG 22137 / NRRL B-23946 / LB-34) TaxID=709986 RepID=E8U9G7_DEIML|nr:cytochrome P450 [Deinococcus maricopensis]ADV67706.1 cytochrome P450 [Deinococcus maricopensis DSM 21211]
MLHATRPPLDSTVPLLTQGYAFVDRQCRATGRTVFDTRLLLALPVTCMRGASAAALLYDPERFVRQGAMPKPVQKTLIGEGGVQSLDGAAHTHRKAMFMGLMTPANITRLVRLADREWHAASVRWAARDTVVLLDEAHEVLTRAVCAWAGVPLAAEEVAGVTADLAALIDGPASAGPRHWRARAARRRAEAWAAGHIRAARQAPTGAEDGALHVVATHRDERGALLDEHTAAVELLNVLRPTVAVARYVVFAAHALHQHPSCRDALLRGDDDALLRFVQEVRRYYPFFPFVAARVRRTFEWSGHTFPQGRLVLLDVYGTNRDPSVWAAPERFDPERFRTWNGSPFNFVPQGGGDHDLGHRCAGEWLTIELMRGAVRFLTRDVTYDVPPQDLRVRLTRMPAQPESGFVLRGARRTVAFAGGLR